jgi:hypothetical protein
VNVSGKALAAGIMKQRFHSEHRRLVQQTPRPSAL